MFGQKYSFSFRFISICLSNAHVICLLVTDLYKSLNFLFLLLIPILQYFLLATQINYIGAAVEVSK